jgi:predicted acyltransferase
MARVHGQHLGIRMDTTSTLPAIARGTRTPGRLVSAAMMTEPVSRRLTAAAGVAPFSPDISPSQNRLASVDFLRGVAILAIIGADQLTWAVRGLLANSGWPMASLSRTIAGQFEHAEWEGLRFYDLVLPLLIFLAGVSIVFSVRTHRVKNESQKLHWKILRRAACLYALGIAYYGGLTTTSWADVRFLGVLQRIAICYLVAAFLILHIPRRMLAPITAGILISYWAAFELISVDGIPAGSYLPENNLAQWFDRRFLPGRLWYGTWDPEGLFSTVPAIASCLLGVFAGLLLTRDDIGALHKASMLSAWGVATLMVGSIWSVWHPVVKSLWTSSYVLVAGGYSFLLLALAFFVADIWCLRIAPLFIWIGANALILYLLEGFFGFANLAEWLIGTDARIGLEAVRPGAGATICAAAGLLIAILLAKVLYSKGLLLRV